MPDKVKSDERACSIHLCYGFEILPEDAQLIKKFHTRLENESDEDQQASQKESSQCGPLNNRRNLKK